MKQCKSTLRYHGKPQVVHAFELLAAQCEQAFISSQKEQAHIYAEFPQIHDMYPNLGPVNGILSAMTAFPEVAWLVLANDMPYVDGETLRRLICHRDPGHAAVTYHNPQKNFPEPLCTIYEPTMKTRLLEFLASGGRIFRKVLENPDIRCLTPPCDFTVFNVNYPEEYTQVLNYLSRVEVDIKHEQVTEKSFHAF
jgi:cyclic pyranopterin phosphate synthase